MNTVLLKLNTTSKRIKKVNYKSAIFTALFLLLFSSGSAFSQEKKSPLSLGVDVYSRYVWRALSFSTTPNIQPYVTLQLGNFSLTSWGSYGIGDKYAEIDFFANYTIKNFAISLNDYYSENENDFTTTKYTDFDKRTSPHLVEAMAVYQLGSSFPLKLTASMFIFGAYDRNIDKDEQFNSLYFEALYPFTSGGNNYSVLIGMNGNDGYYGSGPNVVNMGFNASKTIKVTDTFSIPVNASIIFNPHKDDIFFVIGMTF